MTVIALKYIIELFYVDRDTESGDRIVLAFSNQFAGNFQLMVRFPLINICMAVQCSYVFFLLL